MNLVMIFSARFRPSRGGLRFLLLSVICLSLSCRAGRRAAEVDSVPEPPGLVVSSHPEATRAGLQILRQGGNAVDAAVATGLALGVVDQFNSGIGGGGFMLIRQADGRVFAIDGREKAPAAASQGMFVRNGRYDPDLSRRGPLAVGVPGILAAYEKALALAGSKPLGELIEPAVSLADEGFSLDRCALSRYAGAVDALRRDPASKRIYCHADGSPLKEGEVLRQPELAETFRRIGREGSDYFYRGEFARRLASYMAERGGLITFDDMCDYRAVVREPITGVYRGYTVFGMPPPSSGGVDVVEILNMIEASRLLERRRGWNLKAVYWTSRFMAKTFEDRAAYLGDSDFYPVPVVRLTSKEYAEKIVADLMQGAPVPGADAGRDMRPEGGHTTSFVVLDRHGNLAAVNQTVNLAYGAKLTLPGTGVILNNEMDDFSAQPGTPNAFGLVGSEANAIEPGKRPLSSMSPTIVVRGAQPVMALGGAGGPTIITAVSQVIVNVLDFRMDLPLAVSWPRFHHQYLPDALFVEEISPLARLPQGSMKGMKIVPRDHIGIVNAIAWSGKERAYVGVSDPRVRESRARFRLRVKKVYGNGRR